MKKQLYLTLGFLLLGLAYIGWIIPGIPFSIPAVFAAICFAKSNDKLHKWMMNHKKFGPFVNNWETKKVFPTKMKYVMLFVMLLSLLFVFYSSNGNLKAVLYSGMFMIFGAVWGWRYPGSTEEYDNRVKLGKKIGWIK